jgi:hypothetical protein
MDVAVFRHEHDCSLVLASGFTGGFALYDKPVIDQSWYTKETYSFPSCLMSEGGMLKFFYCRFKCSEG